MEIKCPNRKCETTLNATWKYCPECGFNVDALLKNESKLLEHARFLDQCGQEAEAAYFYKKCEDLGNSDAMYYLGLLYENGQGVEQNQELAIKQFEKAIDKNHISAICWLADAYRVGKLNISVDLNESLEWYRFAFDLGMTSVQPIINELENIQNISIIEDEDFEEATDDEDVEEDAEDNQTEGEFNLNLLDKIHELKSQEGKVKKHAFSKSVIDNSEQQIYSEEDTRFIEIKSKIQSRINELNNRMTPPKIADVSIKDERIQAIADRQNYISDNSEKDELETTLDSPYFGRLVLKDEKGEIIDAYIGKKHINTDEDLVFSWYSEIGDLFRDDVKTKYNVNSHKYALKKKRQISIKKSRLIEVDQVFPGSTTAKEMIYDKFLLRILQQKKDDKRLTDIIPSIQSNQNSIIIRPEDESLIVQGCAGSGKTMILLHRLSYLSYRGKIKDYDKVLILTPSDSFNFHIDSLWQELDLSRIKKMTVTEYYTNKLIEYDKKWAVEFKGKFNKKKNKWDKQPRKVVGDNDLPVDVVNYYYSNAFIDDVNKKLPLLKSKFIEKCTILEKEYNQKKLPEYEQKLKTYNSRPLSSRGKKPKKPKLSYPLIDIYRKDYAFLRPNGFGDTRYLHKCELFACLYLYFEMMGGKSKENMLNIDEAQDLNINEYKLLSSLCSEEKMVFNLYGDTAQLLNKDNGITDWSQLKEVGVFEQYELNENYRNTVEITNYVNDELGYKMTALGIEGNQVMPTSLLDVEKVFDKTEKDDRTAIIVSVNNIVDLSRIKDMISNRENTALLSVHEAKGIEYDRVVAVTQNMTPNEKYIALTRALSVLYVV